MNEFFILLNIAFAVLFGKWARDYFEKDVRPMGWLYLVASAWNAASAAASII